MPRQARIKLKNYDVIYEIESQLSGASQGRLLDDRERAKLMQIIQKWASVFALDMQHVDIHLRGFNLTCKFFKNKPGKKSLTKRLKDFYCRFYSGQTLRQKLKKLKDAGFIHRERQRLSDVSEFIKNVKQCFAAWYNKKHNRQGPLFAGRFKSMIRACYDRTAPVKKILSKLFQIEDIYPSFNKAFYYPPRK